MSSTTPPQGKETANRHTSNRYPWDAILIPSEPEPEDFDTFEAFEAAMRRWAHLVSQIEVIPLHASQLPSVIPLAQPTQQQQVKTSDQIVGIHMTAPRRGGLQNVDFWDPLKSPPWRDETKPGSEQRSVFLPDLDVDELDALADETGAMEGGTPRGLPLPRLSDASTLSEQHWILRTSVGSASEVPPPRPSICTEDVIADFQIGIATILSRAHVNHEKYPPYFNAPVLGELRGTFKKPEWAGHRTGLQLRSDVLRRTDLTPLQIESSHSCRPTIGGQLVEFNPPEFDLARVTYRDLVRDSAYRNDIRQQVLQLQFHARHFPCYSWYRTTPQSKIRAELDKLKALVKRKSRQVTIADLSEFLLGPLDLDVFQDMLGEDIELPNGETTTNGSVLAQSIKVDQFPHLLELFLQTQEPLAHAKISAFVSNVLQLSKAHELVQYLVGNGRIEAEQANERFAHLASSNTNTLSSPRIFMSSIRTKGSISGLKYLPLVCYALTYFRPVKVDLYPYSPEAIDLATKVVGTEYKQLIDLIFIHYYVKTIHNILQSQSLAFGTAAQMVTRTLAMVSSSLFGQLSAYPAFLGSMMNAIGYRSANISSIFTFITLQLLHCDGTSVISGEQSSSRPTNSRATVESFGASSSSSSSSSNNTYVQQIQSSTSGIKVLLTDPSVGLLGSELKRLASSKFSHVRHACRRIVSVLSSPSWIETSLSLIESSMNQAIGPYNDITNPELDISPYYLEALGSILKEAILRAITSADHLTSNPGQAATLVMAPTPSARSAQAARMSPSTSTSTLSTVTTTTSYQDGLTASSSSSASPSNSTLSSNPIGHHSSPEGLRSPVASAVASTPKLPSLAPAPSPPPIVQIPYSELAASHASSISFLLSNRVLYSLLRICGDTIGSVDHRTEFAACLLSQLGRAYTRLRSFKLAQSMSDPAGPPTGPMKRISTRSLLQPHVLANAAILSQMRDWRQYTSGRSDIEGSTTWIGLHELKGIFQFLHSSAGAISRSVHSARKYLLIFLRQLLKSSVVYEAAKSELSMHQTLASFCRSRPYSTNTEAWRCLYQMVKFHPNTIDYLAKNKFLNLYFDGLGSYGSGDKWEGLFMTQNTLKYMTKLFSLNSEPTTSSKRHERTTSTGSPAVPASISSFSSAASSSGSSAASSPPIPLSPNKSQQATPDAKALSQFIINSHVFIKFHVIYKKLSEMDCGAAYAELISFYYALITLPNCKKLLKATAKHDSFREGISAVTQLAPLIHEMQKQDKLWSASRAIITKDKIRAFKMREKDDSSSSPRKSKKDTKDKPKDKDKDKDKDKKKKEKEKDSKDIKDIKDIKIRRGKSGQLPVISSARNSSSSNIAVMSGSTSPFSSAEMPDAEDGPRATE